MLLENKTLILGLDETLIHSKFEEDELCDYLFNISHDGVNYNMSMNKRPFLSQFLEKMSKYYEIIFFTTSIQKYANKVVSLIDPKKYNSGILYRDACFIKDGIYVKNIGRLGRDPKSIVILDNIPTSY